MDPTRFDNFTRRVFGSTTRRGFLGLVLGSLAVAAPDDVEAANRICRLGGDRCVRNGQCCSGVCRTGSAWRRSQRHTCTCYPICANRCGGPDGCGGTCPNTCEDDQACHPRRNTCCDLRCDGKCGGPDGCEGECPFNCGDGDVCHADTDVCCTPNCGGKCGGDDGCGGVCPDICTGSDVCAEDVCCTPNCGGKTCGDDGCGGSCGACGSGLTCNQAGTVCVDQCFGGTRGKRCALTVGGKFFLNVEEQSAATDGGTVKYCSSDSDCTTGVHLTDGCPNYDPRCATMCITKDYAGGNGTVNYAGTAKCIAGEPGTNLPKDARCLADADCTSGTCAADGYCS